MAEHVETQDAPGAPAEKSTPLRTSEEIQGNILAGFNKDHQVFLALSFGEPRARRREEARAWLAEVVVSIATTRQVAGFNDTRRRQADPAALTALWVNVGLTSSGLLALDPSIESGLDSYHAFRAGPTGARPDSAAAGSADRGTPARSAGNAGTAGTPESAGTAGTRGESKAGASDDNPTTADLLGDTGSSDPSGWLVGQPGGPTVDALLTIAGDDVREVDEAAARHRALADRFGFVTIEQRGGILRGPGGARDHFGFTDGISQPGVRGFSRSKRCATHGRDEDSDHRGAPIIGAGEFVLGREREPEGPGCRREGMEERPRPTPPRWMRDGSFQVFRRLTQDVTGWHDQLRRHGEVLDHQLVPVDPDTLAAKAIGRWGGGAPLALRTDHDRTADIHRADYNHFDYQHDPAGMQTPRFAHIRKMNPRDNTLFCEVHHRILRRGIPFGPALDVHSAGSDDPEPERGLLFNAFMADIEDQYEFLQRRWANNSRFPTSILDPDGDPYHRDGPDPLVGVNGRTTCAFRQQERLSWLDFQPVVHTTGAVYAFVPSLSTLRALASGEPLPLGP